MLHRIVEGLLSSILDGLVNCEHHRLAGMCLDLVAFKRSPLAVSLKKDLARVPTNPFIEILLHTSQSNFVSSHEAKYVRGQRVVWIVALRLSARINPIQI